MATAGPTPEQIAAFNQHLVDYNSAAGTPFPVVPGSISADNADGTWYDTSSNNTTYQAPPDPYAKWGGKGAYDNLVSGFNNQKSNIYGSANDAARNMEGGLNLSIQDTIHNLQQGQNAINRKAVNNESSKIQGTQGVLGMVSRGIKSGGVMLANRNAGSSSAAGAIANAYGQQGQRELSKVGNQYQQNAGDIAVDQGNQDWAVSQAPAKFHETLMGNVNQIVASARDQLGALDAAMANASLPDRIAIEQEKEAIKGQVLGILQKYDSQLQAGVSGIHANTREQNMTNAQTQIAAGTADPNLFNYTDQSPLAVADTGPAASALPIFTYSRRRQA